MYGRYMPQVMLSMNADARLLAFLLYHMEIPTFWWSLSTITAYFAPLLVSLMTLLIEIG